MCSCLISAKLMDPEKVDKVRQALVFAANQKHKMGATVLIFTGDIPHIFEVQEIFNEFIGEPEKRNKKIFDLIRAKVKDNVQCLLFCAQITPDNIVGNVQEGLLILQVDREAEKGYVYEKNGEQGYMFNGLILDDLAGIYGFQHLF